MKEEDEGRLEEVRERFNEESPLFIGYGDDQALNEIEGEIVSMHKTIQEVFYFCMFLYSCLSFIFICS